MKRIAIITPCILPVPATKGGAVEALINRIIDDNELFKGCEVDLFTIADASYDRFDYDSTNLIELEYGKITRLTDRVLDKYCRSIAKCSSKRLIDNTIVKVFEKRLQEIDGEYQAVIVENMMSTAVKLVHMCEGKYEFPFYFHMHNDIDIYRSAEYIAELVKYGVQFISVSEYLKGNIQKCNPSAKVFTLYNGVDLTEYKRSPQKESKQTSYLYAGRVIPDKGVKELLSAFILFYNQLDQKEKENVKLDIVGFSGIDADYENEIKKIAGSYPNITCKDQIPKEQMADLYDQADVVVMPTLVEESFGLVALETMAKGKALITTNSGALPEVIADTAIIVDKSMDIVKPLSDAMMKLYRDVDYRNALGEAAYKRSRNDIFDISIYYQGFLDIINNDITDEKISVIVPVYNVAEYLGKCVDSIMGQTYKNLEILLVDDGSKDNSGEICDEYALKDSRIRVIHQKNGGLSAARNTGLNAASGEYVFFCDSDDYIELDALEKLHSKLAADNADIVACGFSEVWEKEGKVTNKKAFTSNSTGRWSGHESIIQMMRTNNICTVAWNKLYKRDLFDDVRFPEGRVHEDEATIYKALYKAKIVSFLPVSLYNYIQRNESIMHSQNDKRNDDLIMAGTERVSFFRDKNEIELMEYSLMALLEFVKDIYRKTKDNGRKKELSSLYNQLLKENSIPDVLGNKKKIALCAWKYIKY